MHSIPASFSTLQRIFLAVGCVGLVISCLMTFKFGYSMSLLHAVALCTVTVMAAFIFPARKFIESAGHIGAARWIGLIGCFFLSLEFFSDLGYTIGMREKSTMEAGVQTAAYQNVQDNLASQKDNLSMWTKHLKDLEEQNGWVASVSADALRAQLADADKQIELETDRGGCKTKCGKLIKAKADLESRIATAEEVKDLRKQIDATQRIIAGATDKAVTVEHGFSPVKAQTDFVSQIWNIAWGVEAKKALNPDEVTLTVTQIFIGFFIALGACLLPTAAFYLAFWGQKVPDETEEMTNMLKSKAQPATKDGKGNTVWNVTNLDPFGKRIVENMMRLHAAAGVPA